MSTRERVIETIADVLETTANVVRPETRFIDDLGATSLDIVNLIWRIEEVFALGETPESELENIETVNDLIELVDAMRSDEPSEVLTTTDVLIASDHAGVDLKSTIVDALRADRFTVTDLGPADRTSVDYPSFAELVAQRVARGESQFGILICGTGIGMSIAANKVKGIRAALVSDTVSASATRRHNNANILCLGARIVGPDLAVACVRAFLDGAFDPGDDGRHQRRINMIHDIEAAETHSSDSG